MGNFRSSGQVGRPPAGVRGQRVRDYPQISVRVPASVRAQLATRARATGLSQWRLIIRAIDCFHREVRASRGRRRRKSTSN